MAYILDSVLWPQAWSFWEVTQRLIQTDVQGDLHKSVTERTIRHRAGKHAVGGTGESGDLNGRVRKLGRLFSRVEAGVGAELG